MNRALRRLRNATVCPARARAVFAAAGRAAQGHGCASRCRAPPGIDPFWRRWAGRAGPVCCDCANRSPALHRATWPFGGLVAGIAGSSAGCSPRSGRFSGRRPSMPPRRGAPGAVCRSSPLWRRRAEHLQRRQRDIGPAKSLKLANEIDHFVLLLPRDLGKHRQRQDTALLAMGIRKLLGPSVDPAIGGEER